jgi:extracellular elastinolytic metalloproteinase
MNNAISIYPNPAKDNFILQINKNIKNIEINIFNVFGEKIFIESNSNISSKRIYLNNVPDGIYFVICSDGNTQFSQKLIIQK